ncbi:MAG: hypothetical protein J0I07_25275 [Myxococcales bacterium]|nr:hypothetical protein [Myxococcales bacterium]
MDRQHPDATRFAPCTERDETGSNVRRERLDASVGYADLTLREADLAIRTTRPTSGELVAVKLAMAPVVALASPAYARSLGKLRSLDDARWIVLAGDLAHLPEAAWLRKHAPKATVVLRRSSPHLREGRRAHSRRRRGRPIVVHPQPFEGPRLIRGDVPTCRRRQAGRPSRRVLKRRRRAYAHLTPVCSHLGEDEIARSIDVELVAPDLVQSLELVGEGGIREERFDVARPGDGFDVHHGLAIDARGQRALLPTVGDIVNDLSNDAEGRLLLSGLSMDDVDDEDGALSERVGCRHGFAPVRDCRAERLRRAI